MSGERNPLLCCRLIAAMDNVKAHPDQSDSAWQEAQRDYAATEVKDPELDSALASRDVSGVQKIFQDWDGDRRPRPQEDRTLLKKAMKSFRKRLKLTRLDDESRLGVGATTRGGASGIVGITPPSEYPEAVWRELARQGRLKAERDGVYALNE